MLQDPKDRINFLRQVLIFTEIAPDQLGRIAELMDTEFVKEGQIVFEQGDERDNLYFVTKGEVRVCRTEVDGSETYLSTFDYGDTFGEDALVNKRPRSATIIATADTDLLVLKEEHFDWMRRTFSQVEPYLLAFTKTHDTIRRLKVSWLGPEETINLVGQRHPIRLVEEVFVTFLILLIVLTLTVVAIVYFQSSMLTIISASLGGLIALIGVTASVWSYFEWKNDYFFITNLRVVWRERIIFRSASRQEVPLRTMQSLSIQSSNIIARSLRVGDLIIQTYNSQLKLTDIYHPERMKRMIEAFISKERTKNRRIRHGSMRRSVRQSIGIKDPPLPTKPPPPAAEEKIQRLSIFKNRIIGKDRITYRKHWVLFLTRAWQPTLAFLGAVIASIVLTPILYNSSFGLIGLLGFYFVPVLIAGWWFYQYEDWRNDIYMISKTQIIDRDKKPLGEEKTDSASIDRIQSVRHEIPNTLYLILNVGNVKIDIGEKTFTFDGVYDPSLVHSDISRFMEEFHLNAEQKRLEQEHQSMTEWIKIYHEESRNQRTAEDSQTVDVDDGPDRW
jgi:hypothetical protein